MDFVHRTVTITIKRIVVGNVLDVKTLTSSILSLKSYTCPYPYLKEQELVLLEHIDE